MDTDTSDTWWGPIDGPRPVHFAVSSKKQEEQGPSTRCLAEEDHDVNGLWQLPTARASFIGACENRVVVPGARRTIAMTHQELDEPRRRLYDLLRALQERERELAGLAPLGGSGQQHQQQHQQQPYHASASDPEHVSSLQLLSSSQSDLAPWAPKGARLEGAGASQQQHMSSIIPTISSTVLKEELPRAAAERRALEEGALGRASELLRLEEEVRNNERLMAKLEDQLMRQQMFSSSCSTSLGSAEISMENAISAAVDDGSPINCWRESAVALEGEIRRKAARALELHHRVHRLESELRRQLQVNEDNVARASSALQSAWQTVQALIFDRARPVGLR